MARAYHRFPRYRLILFTDAIPRAELEAEFGLDLSRTLLITYHPVTLEEKPAEHISTVLQAVSASGYSLLFTYPNADPSSSDIMRIVHDFVAKNSHARLAANLAIASITACKNMSRPWWEIRAAASLRQRAFSCQWSTSARAKPGGCAPAM